ncbi:unnamed protein product, partial [Iphiclides podalirius]
MSSSNNVSRSSLGSRDRKLRYRALLEDLSTLDDKNDVDQMEHTKIAVNEVKSLLAEGGLDERVKHPGEGYLDSRVLRATSDRALRCSEAVSGNVNTYDRHELAQRIRENPSFWEFPFPREAPAVACLFGAFAPTPPEQRPRAPRKRIERQQLAALKAPEAVDRMEKTEEGSEMVSRAHRFLSRACGRGPVSYFHAVLDPTSFCRTVENVYYVSFLVRDGMVAVEVDEEHGIPFVRTLAPSQEQKRHDSSRENQFVVTINMDSWRELVEAFDIKKPMMVLKQN